MNALQKITVKYYDRSKIDFEHQLFSRKALWLLLIPLIIEQMLNALMGMADSMMVSRVGAAAISSVTLVDSINALVLQVFAAMATGAAIICSQYLGHQDQKTANEAARQIMLTVTVISVTLTIVCVAARRPLLRLIFGSVDDDVMSGAQVYFFFTALSYPFIALSSAGSAFYRSCRNSRFPMLVSLGANALNIIGNAFFIFSLHLGVQGAALATLISRAVNAVILLYMLRFPRQEIVVRSYHTIRPNLSLIKRLLAIGVPAGIENGMFQFGKLAIQSTVSSLGTTAIAAQAIMINFETVNGMAAVAVGIGLMTVCGQCIGAGRFEEAKYNILRLCGYAEICIIASCVLVQIAATPVTKLAGLSAESAALCIQMSWFITITKPLVWVPSFIPAYGMRAAGDVKFSMITATLTMWLCRVVLSILFIRVAKVGAIGVWYGMASDWAVRAIIFTIRYRSGKWLNYRIV